jgi:hypothetical protein
VPLSTKHRSSLYHSLTPLVGAEEADALLNEFPANEGDELVTKQVLRAELAELRVEVHDGFRRQTAWTIGFVLTALSVQTAVLALVR